MLNNIIRQLREAHHLTQEDVSKYLNVQRTTYTRYETGTNSLSFETLCKIADLYNVTTDFLLGRNQCCIENIDTELVFLYDNASPIFKDIVMTILKKGQVYNPKINKISKSECIPIISKEIIGLPIEKIEDNISDTSSKIQNQKVNVGDFAVIATDDSMINANIDNGDYVVIRPQSSVNIGEIALVVVNNNSLIRTVIEQNGFIGLVPANNNYVTKYYKNTDDIYIIGKMIKTIKKDVI